MNDPGPVASPRVYLAGPEVFLPSDVRRAVREAKLAICAGHGLMGVFPGEPSDDPSLAGPERASRFFDRLRAEIDSCVAGIANLTPFRGPSADAGTVWEVGYLVGQGKPVVGYTNLAEHYRQRVGELGDGHDVEDFDLTDNLMIDRGIARSNGGIEVVRSAVAEGHQLTDLSGFERCVEALIPVLAQNDEASRDLASENGA